jgi:voltage-gated potassium channel
MTWRQWAYRNLHTAAWRKQGISPINRIIAVLIVAAVGVAIIETKPTIFNGNRTDFPPAGNGLRGRFPDRISGARLDRAENPDLGGGWKARLRYMLSPPALIDLIALSTLF